MNVFSETAWLTGNMRGKDTSKFSTGIVKNLCLQHLAHFVVRSVDQCKTFSLFMRQRNEPLGARQHEYSFSQGFRFLHLIV